MYGVNPSSEKSHRAFRAKHGFPFPLIVDRGRRIARAYNCASLIVRRTVYVVSASGKIAFAERGEVPASAYLPLLSLR